jgi:3-oxoacyl-[acyl-carrier-protein] synthase II
MMTDRILVTGAGVVSAIGVGKKATLASLLAHRSGVGRMKYLHSVHDDLPVGEVKLSNDELRELCGSQADENISRTTLLGQLALGEALEEAKLSGEELKNVHFISATTVGGMDRREAIFNTENDGDVRHAQAGTSHCGTTTNGIADKFGSFASLSTVSTACSSALNAMIVGANMLRCGLADKVVVGGTECLSLFHLNGFNTLMNVDHELCKPFDKNRNGLNLGEGAAYLVMETEKSARDRGVKLIAEVSGYANRCDAFHQTASSPDGEGAYLAMTDALRMADLKPQDIQYINAHGTGTLNNDASESAALRRVFGEEIPPLSSTKAYTGHTTSASGSIEAVICILALQHQFLPTNLNWHTAMDEGVIPVIDSQQPDKEITHVMTNAFGFGGNDSSFILSNLNYS